MDKNVIDEIVQLKQILKDGRLSQEAVAREIRVSLKTVFNWLHGLNEPKGLSLDSLRKFIKKNR